VAAFLISLSFSAKIEFAFRKKYGFDSAFWKFGIKLVKNHFSK